jgi:hypothetical protein
MTEIVNIESLRVLSQIFTPTSFKKVVREGDFSFFDRKISKHFSKHSATSNLQLIMKIYNKLENYYRCEYIFKNKLFNEILNDYGLDDTRTFSEFKVGSSKADLVLLNGCIKIFEIKTELDDLSKLKKQIEDYQKIADIVNIVSDSKFISKLLIEYKNTNVGIIEFTDQDFLIVHQEAVVVSSMFKFDTLFKMLHKREYLDLVKLNFNFIPDVPNTKVFKVCYKLLETIDILHFQKQIMTILKKRNIECPEILNSSETPSELKHICYTMNFNSNEYEQLFNFLNKKI